MIDVNVKLEGKLGDLGYIVIVFEVAAKITWRHRKRLFCILAYSIYIIFIFVNDYKTNSLDSLTIPKSGGKEPLKLGGLRSRNSLAHDYFRQAAK